MADEIFMIPADVKDAAKSFGEISETLQQVSKGMQAAITVLKTSAFVGLFGNAALASYLENLKPTVDNFASGCAEMAEDLLKSAEAYERGDELGAAKFH
jgi:uncharacterized protein YukE